MPIELDVLSGKRKNARVGFENHEVAMGAFVGANLLFDYDDLGVDGQHALLAMTEDGWSLLNRGKQPLFIGSRKIPPGQTGTIRSNDIVQLSDYGPDVRFRIVATISTSPTAQPMQSQDNGVETKLDATPSFGPPAYTAASTNIKPAPAEFAAPIANVNPPAPQRTAILAGLAAVLLLLCGTSIPAFIYLSQTPDIQVPPVPPPPPPPDPEIKEDQNAFVAKGITEAPTTPAPPEPPSRTDGESAKLLFAEYNTSLTHVADLVAFGPSYHYPFPEQYVNALRVNRPLSDTEISNAGPLNALLSGLGQYASRHRDFQLSANTPYFKSCTDYAKQISASEFKELRLTTGQGNSHPHFGDTEPINFKWTFLIREFFADASDSVDKKAMQVRQQLRELQTNPNSTQVTEKQVIESITSLRAELHLLKDLLDKLRNAIIVRDRINIGKAVPAYEVEKFTKEFAILDRDPTPARTLGDCDTSLAHIMEQIQKLNDLEKNWGERAPNTFEGGSIRALCIFMYREGYYLEAKGDPGTYRKVYNCLRAYAHDINHFHTELEHYRSSARDAYQRYKDFVAEKRLAFPVEPLPNLLDNQNKVPIIPFHFEAYVGSE